MIVHEDILFRLPHSRELQFPAMSALQAYINCYQLKMKNNNVQPVLPTFTFRYWAEIADDDWQFFLDLGIELHQNRQSISYPDAVIDLNEAKLGMFREANANKHCAQICSAIAGVEAPPFPKVRQRKPDYKMTNVFSLLGQCDAFMVTRPISLGELATLPDGIIGCFIGYQGWETYMIAAQGLPVIEILRPGMNESWLSKWSNPFYRVVEENALAMIPQALENLRSVLQWQFEKDQALADKGTTTAPTTSSVPIAVNT
jgi:hypothetical protein